MQEIGKQYPKDDKIDKSGFLGRARLHQSRFRAEYLNLPYDIYGNYLTQQDGENGKNFYDGFDIFEEVLKFSKKKYNKALYSNMLRSEHIPFNFFIPLDKDRNYCKNVFAHILNAEIKSIDKLIIEYAPKPRFNYLKDKTSFDTYIEYTNSANDKGIIGIEVKYTERDYKHKSKTEQENITNNSSIYFEVSKKCGLYKPDALEVLPTDRFRQIWRNHILGESILLVDNEKFRHFTSLTIFPAGNTHFVETSNMYIELLNNKNGKFIALTYEDFFTILNHHCPNSNYKTWINYLSRRYIV